MCSYARGYTFKDLSRCRGCLLSTKKPTKTDHSQGKKQTSTAGKPPAAGRKKAEETPKVEPDRGEYLTKKNLPEITDLSHSEPVNNTDLQRIEAKQSPSPVGRKPIRFKQEYCKLAYELSSKGVYNKDIAKALGIGKTVFAKWIRKYPAFERAIKEGVDSRVLDVEKQMVLGALGKETVTEVIGEHLIKREFDQETGEVISEQVIEVRRTVKERGVPADYNKQRFILLNKAPDRYRKEQDVEGQVVTIIQAPEIKKKKPSRAAAAQADKGNGGDTPRVEEAG